MAPQSTAAAAAALCAAALLCIGLAAGTGFVASPAGMRPRGEALPTLLQEQATGTASGAAQGADQQAAGMLAIGAAGLCACAFLIGRKSAPAKAPEARVVSLNAIDLTTQLGVCPPLGFWDPLGLSEYDDPKRVEQSFKRRRVVEIQHGRVAMFACMGYIVPEFVKFPGYLSPSAGLKFADVPNGLKAITTVPLFGWFQVITFTGIIEAVNLSKVSKDTDLPGDYDGFGAFGLPFGKPIADPEKKKKSLLAEINNGRLAMVAIIGMFFQDGLTGSAWGDWANYADSPLRAIVLADQMGVCPPLGFWDPLGLSEYDDPKRAEQSFKRRRIVEIQHGRVAMFACMGYIVPEFVKFPGYLSPSAGLKFADVPNGLKAISVVPLFGWFQIITFTGIIEAVNFSKVAKDADLPGDYDGFGAFGLPFGKPIADAEKKKKSLLAEINNGRLAMMAIIGMFFQDGLTGSAWGDWANYGDSPLRAFETETGVQAPLGYWDPLGLSSDGVKFDFLRRREVEIKHGRVSMFATIGYIVPEYYRFPGFCSPSYGVKFSEIPNGLGALSKVPAIGWTQIVAFAGLLEINVYNFQKDGEPGNYDSGFLGLRSVGIVPGPFADPEVRKKKLNSELANGRLAMMAIIGMFFQDGLTGSAWGDWALYTDSPLRAFEGELGVQAPVGFWDPLGLSKNGNVESFKRRRETEIKHGRVSMYATMGYITPEFFKFPGYLSPSQGLKFADVPNGLAAISKVPGGGWAQIVAFLGYYELSVYKYSGTPGAYGAPFPGVTSDEVRKKKLSAELANGRLAMMAIIGMFFQDGLTGSAWGDWALYTDSPLRAFETELGVQAPVGFWDPLGLSADGDASFFKRRREVELKHGRISMFACMGFIVPEYFKFPGYLSPGLGLKFSDVPNGLAAVTKVPGVGWGQIVAFLGTYELLIYKPNPAEPGNYGTGSLGLGLLGPVKDPEVRKKKLSAELANGRLAMMAIIGMFFQNGLTGTAWGDWALYTDSPLRAFETELGVQAPVGFWDPLGLSADGDASFFKRRREVELKHGRISMFACMGFIVPEYFKFPGYLSPGLGLKFSDVPNGLAAVTKVPGVGWGQIVAFLGTYELLIYKPNPAEPGNYGTGSLGLGLLGPVKDPEVRKKKLSAELANGRLAMMAIIGMFFQNGLTGTAWGDWALYTDSPLRAFEGELGVQPPLGFWDPAGLSKDGDAAVFRRRRESEIKHGRIAMAAAMGYIIPEYVKFPGYCSPTLGIKFADIPNGLAALGKVPGVGLAQMALFAGLVDVGLYPQDPARGPGDFANGGILGVPNGSGPIADEATRNKKLSSELANGRLAMMAIIGMFFQDGLTGSAWGDWALFTASPLR